MGKITKNTDFGIFGELNAEKAEEYDTMERIPVGLRSTIVLGDAQIISNVSGERKEYQVMIDKIYWNDTIDNKSFVIRIVDEELMQLTRWYYSRFIAVVLFYKTEI